MSEFIEGKKILVMYDSKNEKGKKDATGAFVPEAKKFAEYHEIPKENMLAIPCPGMPKQRRLEEVCMFLRAQQNIKWIAMFCHGWSSGLQFGLNKKNIPVFVKYLDGACNRDLKMTLYACSTASTSKKSRKISMPGTDNGYADQLRDALLLQGFKKGWIDAHLTPGHTTRNPFVLRFYTEPRFEKDWDLPGGEWLVSPKSKLWKPWKRAVQNMKTSFRLIFSELSEAEIYEYLANE